MWSLGVRKPTQLQLQMQAWQEDLDKRLKGKKIPPKYWEFPELEKGSIHGHCAYCFDIDCDRTLNIGAMPKLSISGLNTIVDLGICSPS